MAKSKVISKTEQKNDQASYRAMRIFLGAGLAEMFLLMIRNYYVVGTANQVVAWDGYMYPMAAVGLVVALLGLGGLMTKGKASATAKEMSLWVLGAGVFVAIVCFLVRSLYTTLLTPLLATIPVAMAVGILWCLFTADCAMAISTIGVSLLVTWIGRKVLYHLTLGTLAHVGLVVYMVLLAGVAYYTYLLLSGKKKCACGCVGTQTDGRGMYLAYAGSIVMVAINLVSTVMGYYAMLALIAIGFLLAVYYTVKHL